MKYFLLFAFLFFAGSLLGWVLELFYRRFFSNRKLKIWLNPGFLIGPYLPLYGFGLCLLFAMTWMESFIPSKLLLFIMMAIVMTLLEYIAGVIFIKGMNVKLWDYSNCKFNIQGIICLRFSIYWAILGALYYFLIHPKVLNWLYWFAENLAFSFVVGLFFGVFLIDVCYSLQIITKMRTVAKEKKIIVRYEMFKQETRQRAKEKAEKIPFFIPVKSPSQVKDHVIRYIELEKAFKEQENQE